MVLKVVLIEKRIDGEKKEEGIKMNYLIWQTEKVNRFQKWQTEEIFSHIDEKQLIELEAFSTELWLKVCDLKKKKRISQHADLTRNYFNPIRRIQFIGFEGLKFKQLPKRIPTPKGYTVIIRNVWSDKRAYEYPSGKPIEWDDLDQLEDVIFSKLEWCLYYNIDLEDIYHKARNLLIKKLMLKEITENLDLSDTSKKS